MAAALYSVPLASTPPLSAPSRGGAGGGGSKRSSNVVSFRSTTTSDEGLMGSLKGNVSRSSFLEAGLPGSSARSLPRPGRTPPSSGASAAGRGLQSQQSIPRSAAFVKVEGFDTKAASPALADAPLSPARSTSPPASPQPRPMPSLLSRQLSTENMSGLPALLAAAGGISIGLDDPTLAAQLAGMGMSGGSTAGEERVRVVPRPAPLRQQKELPRDVLQRYQEQFPVFREPLVVSAFQIARDAHDHAGSTRAGGEPAMSHCLAVAASLAGLGAGEAAVAAALLHDVLDRTPLLDVELEARLGAAGREVVALVQQVSHLGDISSQYRACPATSPEAQAATASALVSMLVAMGHSTAALLVKLADRLHDMQTLEALPAAKRNLLAQETLDVWAPLANRIGVWPLKAQLEDLAFKQLYPSEYEQLSRGLAQVQDTAVLVRLMDALRARLHADGVSYWDLSGRPKHMWGVFKKMKGKGYCVSQVSDVRGVRIIVDGPRSDCYVALRAVESLWPAVEGSVKDYIRRPKANGYQSLHVVVQAPDGHKLEVQIRTAKMHYFAEYGLNAAHWRYKEQGYGKGDKEAAAPASVVAAPVAAVPAGHGSDGGAAKEANWAKFQMSQQLYDKKCRPSGSPSHDQSLVALVGAAHGAHAVLSSSTLASGSNSLDEADGGSPSGSPPRDARFEAYLQKSGQKLEPPAAERVAVCVVMAGGLEVAEMPQGTTVFDLLQRVTGGGSECWHRSEVIVNRHLETSPGARLATGDIVEIYPAPEAVPVVPALPVVGGARRGGPARQGSGRSAGSADSNLVIMDGAGGRPLRGVLGHNVLPLAGLRIGRRAANSS